MEIKKGKEQVYEIYKDKSYEQALKIANTYADKVEALLKANKTLKLNDAFSKADEVMPQSNNVTGCTKSSAFTILTKVWVHGSDYYDYESQKEDEYAKM